MFGNTEQRQQAKSNRKACCRNIMQLNNMTAGCLIFVSGGMDLALGLGWNLGSGMQQCTTTQYQFSWFIGVIAGAVIAAPLIPILQKRFYMLISSLLVLTSGIIFTSVPFNYSALLAARYVNGVAIGFATVPFIVLASEGTVKSQRGMCLSTEQYATTFGIAIQVIYSSQWTTQVDFAANRLHGIISIVCAVIALGSALIMIESPVFYLRKNDESCALESIIRLQRPQVTSDEKKAYLQDLKNFIVEEDSRSAFDSLKRSFGACIKLIMFRSMAALSFTLPLSGAIIVASSISEGDPNSWPPIVYALLRVFGGFLGLWLVDGLGRKLISLFALACMGGLMIGIGAIYGVTANLYDVHEMSVACCLLLIMQFFAGLYIPATSAYLGEAFPIYWKPYCIALVVAVENVIHIITICTYVFSSSILFSYCIAVGVIMIVFTVLLAVLMPETRKTSLREAQERFKRLLYLRCY